MADDDWYQFGADRCVKVFFKTPHLDWGDAEEACQEYEYYTYSGHLVSIHSEEEWNAVICIMYRVHPGKPTYWIGLTRDPYLFYYKWSDYSTVNFGRLVGAEPDELWGTEYCVEMNYGHWGHWNRNKCSDRRPYMCQVRY
ncbi:C-type lectin BML-1-like [Synchiropus splendidus]|uniref:C-type lectin BML-1-like n=1 Tax=Synchiropus splendidus TaxID=270530 RepID=UPI00237E47F9|nr:C-type lectin BML-1-like [Synchiropus splendidus]